MNIERVGATIDNLGEGLLWDEEQRLLYWTDAMEGIVHRLDPASGAYSFVRVDKMIGAIALRRQGGAIASLEDGFYFLDLDTGAYQPVRTFDLGRPDIRFNDGKVDRQGRFLAGSMHIKAPADGISVGELHRLDPDGTTTLLETGIGNCNGPGFSPDGRIFYFADSPRRQIYAYDYDITTGNIANRRVFAETAEFDSPPDGATVDAEGYLWSTMVMGGKIVRYAPSGAVDRVIDMPVRHPTNVTFGGPDLDVLYVTSISKSPNIAATEPLAGALFAVTGLGVTGLAEPRFAG